MPKADPFQQRRLLDLAAVDRSIGTVAHRRVSLPELAEISSGNERLITLRAARALAEADVSDLDRDARKLDAEIDAVRARAERDAQRLATGAGGAKDLQGLQHEIESLARRQGVLEDDALDLMERRESADAALEAAVAQVSAVESAVAAAEQRRDQTLTELTAQQAELTDRRAAATSGLPADLVALYERIHKSGKVAAGELTGSNCGACRMDIDRIELAAVRSAPMDEVIRCPECGAILIRN